MSATTVILPKQLHSASSSSKICGSEMLAVPDNVKRRSSMPTDSLLIVCRGSNGAANKSARNRKKVLRRRSSGGADILNPVLAEESAFSAWTSQQEEEEEERRQQEEDDETVEQAHPSPPPPKSDMKHSLSWFRLRRDGSVRRATDKEALLSRRRGSLPIEVLAVGHSGEFQELWSRLKRMVIFLTAFVLFLIYHRNTASLRAAGPDLELWEG